MTVEAERDAALARIAAVEALCAAKDRIDATSCEPDGGGWATTNEIRASLAASPTPTGPSHNPSDTGTIVRHPGPATPEPTEETP